ncbi:MAG: small acid-soluble spore protein [Paenibacillus sp.]|jgi:small acid-soluble spore protein H (minor)|nr:small acid-soluble spore protein [Paenibacillus sp.]
MDVNRAQQIFEAADKINVELNGKSVWIDSIDVTSGTARVHEEHNPSEVRKVSLDQLQEV